MHVGRQRQYPFADVLGQIAHPFQIVGDAHRADDLPQIDRHRLPARDGEHGFFLDRVLQRVDLRIDRNSALPEIRIVVGERIE